MSYNILSLILSKTQSVLILHLCLLLFNFSAPFNIRTSQIIIYLCFRTYFLFFSQPSKFSFIFSTHVVLVMTNSSQIQLSHLLFYCCSSTVVSISPSPDIPQPPCPSPPPTIDPYPPFGFVHVSFILVPWQPFLYFTPLFPSPLVTVSLFFISMSLVIFCLLACFVD